MLTFVLGECPCPPPYTHIQFPKDQLTLREWCVLINRKRKDGTLWFPAKSDRICSAHFVDGQPTQENPKPSLLMGHEPAKQKLAHRKIPSDRLVKIIAPKSEAAVVANKTPETTAGTARPKSDSHVEIKREIQPDNETEIEDVARPNHNLLDKIRQKHKKGNKATNHYLQLKAKIKQLQHFLNPKHKQLLDSDKSVHFYTSLPNTASFNSLCKYIKQQKPTIQEPRNYQQKTLTEYWGIRRFRNQVKLPNHTLCVEDKILLTLMKLRLDLLHQDLADR